VTWGKLSDTLHSHPKWTGLSVDGKAMWATAVSYCSAHLTNGDVSAVEHLPVIAMETFGMTPSALRKAQKAAQELVQRRLWELRPEGWRFHDWKDCNPTAQQVKQKKKKDRRRSDLHRTTEGKAIKAAVYARDGLWCRYCGIETRPGHNRSSDGRTLDHIDPEGANSLENVVVSCNYCNGRKWECLPEAAGMTLRDPPRQRSTVGLRLTSDSVRTESAASDGPGSGRVGSGRVEAGRTGPLASDSVDVESVPPPSDHDYPGSAA
jgi:5-methylcytosine-specific restriction endonuclease McrA